jgi:hypothetical protein
VGGAAVKKPGSERARQFVPWPSRLRAGELCGHLRRLRETMAARGRLAAARSGPVCWGGWQPSAPVTLFDGGSPIRMRFGPVAPTQRKAATPAALLPPRSTQTHKQGARWRVADRALCGFVGRLLTQRLQSAQPCCLSHVLSRCSPHRSEMRSGRRSPPAGAARAGRPASLRFGRSRQPT